MHALPLRDGTNDRSVPSLGRLAKARSRADQYRLKPPGAVDSADGAFSNVAAAGEPFIRPERKDIDSLVGLVCYGDNKGDHHFCTTEGRNNGNTRLEVRERTPTPARAIKHSMPL